MAGLCVWSAWVAVHGVGRRGRASDVAGRADNACACRRSSRAAFEHLWGLKLFERTPSANIIYKDLRTLRSGAWVNDVPINAFINAIVRHPGGTESYNTFLYTKLVSQPRAQADADRVGGISCFGAPFFMYERVLVPCNLGNVHWILAWFDLPNRVVYVYDSLGKHVRLAG